MLLFEIVAALWFFAFGAVIGSFLNVVVWRTPRGETLVGPSRCPKCGTAIRWYNNVPVFGWMWLGGKCRDCKLPISPRYPIVEFICGAMFLAVALTELAPRAAADYAWRESGFVSTILDPQWPRIATYGLHMLLLCALLAWALMQVDEQNIPVKQIAGLWLVGFVFAAILPPSDMRVVADGTINNDAISRAWRGLLRAVSGFFIGGCIAVPLALVWRGRLFGGRGMSEQQWAIAAALASVGLILGPAAAIIVLLMTLLLRTVTWLGSLALPPLQRAPLTMDIFAAAVVYVCLAKYLAFGLMNWP